MAKKGITKKELAEKCNINRLTLDNVLNGSDAKTSTIESIAQVLDVSIAYFFDEGYNVKNEATVRGVGNCATNQGNIRIINQAAPSAEACNALMPEDNPRVIHERIRGLEARLKDKDEIIEILKAKMS